VGAKARPARAAACVGSPARWWRESAGRFRAGLRQLWEIRARARSRALPMAPDVRRALDILWAELGEGRGTPVSRMAAARASGALPRRFERRVLVLARIAFLPSLRARLGDERPAGLEPSA
jgi:hypothetical protein